MKRTHSQLREIENCGLSHLITADNRQLSPGEADLQHLVLSEENQIMAIISQAIVQVMYDQRLEYCTQAAIPRLGVKPFCVEFTLNLVDEPADNF